MKKTVKTLIIAKAYQVLSSVKVTRLDASEQSAIVKALRSIRTVGKDYIAQEADIKKMLEPENIDELGMIEAKGASATPEERMLYETKMRKYTQGVNAQLKDLSDKEVEIDVEPVSYDTLTKLAAANDLALGAIMIIDDVFGE